MPGKCSACGSIKLKGNGLSYHKSVKFPKYEIYSKLWNNFVIFEYNMNKKWIHTENSLLCSSHFLESDFAKKDPKTVLKQSAVPSIKMVPQAQRLQSGKVKVLELAAQSQIVDLENSGIKLISVEALIEKHQTEVNCFRQEMAKVSQLLSESKKMIVILKNKNYELEKKLMHELSKTQPINWPLDPHTSQALSEKGGSILSELVYRALSSTKKQSDEKLQKFSISLASYSNKAYNFVRQQFKFVLPSSRTVRRWLSQIDAKPGFLNEALAKLKQLQSASGYPLICSLMFDEVHIRNQLLLDSDGYQVGWTDYGDLNYPNPKIATATSALFVSAVALNAQWKLPIAYFLTNGLHSDWITEVIKNSLIQIGNTGIRAIAVVFDGLPSNFVAVENLGANIDADEMCSWFPHPLDATTNVYVIPDISHMWKLMRNLWVNKQCDGIILDDKGNELRFSIIEKLHRLQQKEGLRAGNKLRNEHIHFQNKKMNVSLATQLFSQSVANALRFCNSMEETRLNGFGGKETVDLANYLDLMDRAFDSLNGRHPLETGRKAPLSLQNQNMWRKSFRKLKSCLRGLSTRSGKKLQKTKLKTGPLGIITAVTSIERIVDELVCCDKPILKYLCPYKFSQDHLELMFSSLRACCGYNNNPNALQLRGAIRTILSSSIEPSLFGNCIPLDLTESLSVRGVRNSFFEIADLDNVMEDKDELELDPSTVDYYSLTQYTKCVTTYIAGYVVKSLSKKLKCKLCLFTLIESDEDQLQSTDFKLIHTKQNTGLKNPSNDVITICKMTESVIRELQNYETHRMTGPNILSNCMRRCVEMEYHNRLFHHQLNIYPEGFQDNHILDLIKLVIQEYSKV